VANGAGGAARWVDVAPERLASWLESFSNRHGAAVAGAGPHASGAEPDTGRVRQAAARPAPEAARSEISVVTFRAADGAAAECHVPFPPLPPGVATPPGAAEIAAHARADRTVGVLLVRLGGYAVGVFTGKPPRLAASKVGSRLVHGRSAAGGTSQHRFARRREKQASEALGAAADTAAAIFGPYAGKLDAVVLGGDRRAIAGVRDDPRLRPYIELAVERFLTVPDPRLVVLRGTPRLFRAVRVRLTEPSSG
jgi:hypothetical protein